MLRSLYISQRFFLALGGIVLIFVGSFAVEAMFLIGQVGLISLSILTLIDLLLIYATKKTFHCVRELPNRMDLNEDHLIKIKLFNKAVQPYFITLYDEPPVEMQARDLVFKSSIGAQKRKEFSYTFRPKRRGKYSWGDIHIYMGTILSLVNRKIVYRFSACVPVYPSVVQMKKYEFLVFNQQAQQRGIKRIRRIGQNNEFEQIKNYTQGDDLRSLNWKASSRKNELMVNQYQEEKSQNIFALIDKSRPMAHQFEHMTLLDHSINSSLVFGNIALKKGDRFGIITFADKIGSKLASSGGVKHANKVMGLLYNQRTHFKEANYELLYHSLRKNVRTRSLLILYTNFDTDRAMKSALPILKQIARKHLLVVVFFENTTLQDVMIEKSASLREVYQSALAEDVINDKRRIALHLNRNGIHTILTNPELLNVNTINKYLTFKAKGLI